MYVVKRPFRNAGEVMVPGSVVEPGIVKHFRARLGDNHIVEVNEHNFDKWKEFFSVRYNVQISLPVVKTEATPVVAPKVPAKPAAKATSAK